MMATSATEDDGEALVMSGSYQATAPDRSGTVCAPSPESIRDFLRREAAWPSGRYEITNGGLLFSPTPKRWGVAIKHPDGSVELVPDGA
jgi:hypothetical protein